MISSLDEFIERLRNDLKRAIDEADKQMGEGYAHSFDEYRDRVGYRRGLAQTLNVIIPEIEKQMGQ